MDVKKFNKVYVHKVTHRKDVFWKFTKNKKTFPEYR